MTGSSLWLSSMVLLMAVALYVLKKQIRKLVGVILNIERFLLCNLSG
jgi:hypothetical protein